MESLEAVKMVDEMSGDAHNKEQNEQHATKDKCKIKGAFSEWLKATAPCCKYKKGKFSKKLLKGIDSDGRDFRSWREYLDEAKICFDNRMRNPQLPLVEKIDFEFLKTLGIGAFSKVMLVKHTNTNIYYAAKLLRKSALVHSQHIQHARNEKLILQSIRFVFTIHLEFFFQDNVYIFFVFPLIAGGELLTYLDQVNRLTEDHARFYSAQILLALEYLHYIGLVFRDLKPENILIDSIGYLKLADFGFCKAIDLRTYTLCGTPEYVAPEMLCNKGYGKSVDWWTFGVLLYELCAGYTPFYANLETKIYDNISRCRYRFPYHFSNDLRSLIGNIFQLDLTKRYGNLKNGVDDIKEHNFYDNVPWTMLLNREIKAPYIPVITRPDDTSNFQTHAEKPLGTFPIDLYYREFADF